jgi:hypothetical protein
MICYSPYDLLFTLWFVIHLMICYSPYDLLFTLWFFIHIMICSNYDLIFTLWFVIQGFWFAPSVQQRQETARANSFFPTYLADGALQPEVGQVDRRSTAGNSRRKVLVGRDKRAVAEREVRRKQEDGRTVAGDDCAPHGLELHIKRTRMGSLH